MIFFLGGILIIPFFYLPNSPIPFEIPKVWLFNRWIETIVISGLIFSISEIKKDKTDMFMIAILSLFLAVSLVTAFTGVDIQKSFLGNYYRGDGLFTLFHLVSLFLFIVLFFRAKWLKPTIISISASAVGISLWTISDAFRLYILNNPAVNNWEGALAVSFGNPNFLSGFLLVTLPFTAYLINTTKKKHYYFGMLVQISAIFLTLSRAGIMGILIFFSLWYLTTKKIRPVVIIFTTFVFLIFSSYFVRNDAAYKSGVLVSESRQRIYTKAYMAFLKKPLMGWGWANFDHAFDSVVWPIEIDDDVYVDKAHSIFVEILISTGLFGLIIYILFTGKSINNLFTSQGKVARYLLMSLVLYVIHSQLNVISISEEAVFWIITGISTKRSLFH